MKYLLEALVNPVLWIMWPLVSFFRYAFYSYHYQSSVDNKKSERFTQKSKVSQLISIRAHVIEVCIESSLQPLLQLYLVLISVYEWNQIKAESRLLNIDTWLEHLQKLIEFLRDKEVQRILSSVVSILMIALSYTTLYNQQKNQVLSGLSKLLYFGYVLLSVISRILCFQMFAFYLGPGSFYAAFAAVLAHVLLMACLHWIWSEPICTFKNCNLRQTFLIAENCFVNGLANLYVYNSLNLDFDVQLRSTQTDLQEKRTLFKQITVDIIIFIENVIMLCLGMETMTSTTTFTKSYWMVIVIVAISYLTSMTLKILFYCFFHPWNQLIQAHTFVKSAAKSDDDENENTKKKAISVQTIEIKLSQ